MILGIYDPTGGLLGPFVTMGDSNSSPPTPGKPVVLFELTPAPGSKGTVVSNGTNDVTLSIVSGETFTGTIHRVGDPSTGFNSSITTPPDASKATASISGNTVTIITKSDGEANMVITTGSADLFTVHLNIAKPAPIAAKITAQPQTYAMYQEGGKLEITGAAVADAVSTQWQQQNTDGSWKDTGVTAVTFIKAAGEEYDDGTYRLMAVGTDAQPVYSNTVSVHNVYLKLQDDTSPNSPSFVKNDNFNYTWTRAAGGRYLGSFFFTSKDDTQFVPPGATGGRAQATWTTDNQAVVPIPGDGTPGSATSGTSGVQANGQLVANMSKGTAHVTASYGNLKSNLTVNIT